MNKPIKASIPPARQIPTKASWHFFAVLAATPSGFQWQWQKQGSALPVTSAPFDFYFDCISDARGNGYVGPLPPGPKVALKHLPFDPTETGRVLAALSPKSDNVVMTVRAIPTVNVKGRGTRERSRVS